MRSTFKNLKFFEHYQGKTESIHMRNFSSRRSDVLVPETSRNKIESSRDLVISAKSEGAMYEALERILTRACLDLTPADAKEVLVFVTNHTAKLRVQHKEKPDLIGFLAARDIANKIADGTLSIDEKKALEVPSAYLIVCAVEVKYGTIETLQSMRYLFVLSRHSPATHLQYGLSINEKDFRLLCLGLDVQEEFPRISWTAQDYCVALYSYVRFILNNAIQRFSGVPKFWTVIEMKEGKKAVGLYTIQLGGVDHYLLPIFAGRANGRKSFVALASAGKDEELKVLKLTWRLDGEGREYHLLKKLHGVPGVVQMDESLSVEALEKNGRERTRSLLVLKTVGYSISSCRTVLEFLEAMYDLLEVLRYLVDKKKIMHRDVSWSNVLILPDDRSRGTQVQVNREPVGPRKDVKEDEPVQIGANSGNGVPHKYRYISNIYGEPHFRVRVALADFDFATDLESGKDELKDATGTPMFMANDFIAPRVHKVLLPEYVQHGIREAAIGSHRKYADEKEASEWDKFYDEEMRSPDWIFDDRSSTPQFQIEHCAVHDAESVFCLCLLFFSRLWPVNVKVKATEVEKLKRDRGDVFEMLTLKQGGNVVLGSFVNLPANGFPTGDRFAPFYNMLNTIQRYLWIPWYAVRDSQHGQRYEFHLHDFMQRLLIKEIERLRESGDPIELEENPLPVVAASQYSGNRFTTSARALAVSGIAKSSIKDSDDTGRRASGKRGGQTSRKEGKRAKTDEAEGTIDDEPDESEELGLEDRMAAMDELNELYEDAVEAASSIEEEDVLPVSRPEPERESVPEELPPFFSEKALDVFWRKEREKLWFIADKYY